MEKKRSVGVTTFAILKTKVIVGIIAISVMSTCGYVFSNQEDARYDAYEENCGDIWCVKSIVVHDNNVLIEFDTNSGGFQVVYRRGKDNTVIPLEYGNTFALEIGENIGWGDGDHAFASIVLDDIKDKVAFVTIGDEHRPPPTHKYLEYSKSRKCKIHDKYSSPAPK